MANSKYEYVKTFEQDIQLLPGCWLVVRVDGRGFTKFSEDHAFIKPNDEMALRLMNACASALMKEFPDISLAFGESDEFSFVLHKDTKLWGRRAYKIVSVFTSFFTSHYVFLWRRFFPDKQLKYPPQFDGRAVVYPTDQAMRDYVSWRQVDVHVNNQYNTCFWALVQSGVSKQDAQKELAGTLSDFKNEMLFSRFGINYAHLPEMFRRGSVLVRRKEIVQSDRGGKVVEQEKSVVAVVHEDMIKDAFWERYPSIFSLKKR